MIALYGPLPSGTSGLKYGCTPKGSGSPRDQVMRRFDELVVLQLDGWKESAGVRAEMALASELGKRVDYRKGREAI